MGLTLIRHTTPEVPPGTCYGQTDLDLKPGFAEEAEAVLAALPPAERLITSPLRRCARLAERIGAARGLLPVPEPRLMEMDFGRWEGVPWDRIPRAELDAWAADFDHARPHGGESVAIFAARVEAALSALRDGT
ncbi:MAG: histidine phosphatase family protein, partial [Pseudomonadota bacterium]